MGVSAIIVGRCDITQSIIMFWSITTFSFMCFFDLTHDYHPGFNSDNQLREDFFNWNSQMGEDFSKVNLFREVFDCLGTYLSFIETLFHVH